MQRRIALLAFFSLLFVFQACSSYKHNPDREPVKLGVEYHGVKTTSITLNNAYSAEKKFRAGESLVGFDGDYKQITDALMVRMNREFAANKISVAPNSAKTVTLKARDITLATRSFGPATLRAVLEAELSNGEKVITAADQQVFYGKPENYLDGLLVQNLGKIMNHEKFIAFMKQ